MFWTAAALLVTLASASTSLLGGPIDVDINTPEVQDALNFAVDELNKQSNDVYVSKVTKVIKAQSQVCLQSFPLLSFASTLSCAIF